ncbi:MAG: hypothetical protein U5M53_10995 [Rhodoferax sp.]|nr:hypothetical protein [Rhodoferax sp.]
MSITNDLLTLVLDTAKAQGLDQKALATKAGVRAETISRAKQRGTADLDTVAVPHLASCHGRVMNMRQVLEFVASMVLR